jgi:hypothetical protein
VWQRKKSSSSGAVVDGRKNGSSFVVNPATGALEVSVDLKLKIENALRAEVRRLQRGSPLTEIFRDAKLLAGWGL